MADATRHEFIKPEKIAGTAIGMLDRELLSPNLIWRWSESEFKGAKDDTVNIIVPGKLKARDRALRAEGEDRKIKMDYLKDTKLGVKLTDFPYSAVPVTDEELTLDIENFAARILAPQVRAMAEKIESQVINAISTAKYVDGTHVDQDTGDLVGADQVKGTLAAEDFYGAGQLGMYTMFNRLRKQFRLRHIPDGNRVVLVGADFEEEILNTPHLVKANEAGTDSALREATIGRLSGFDIIVSDAIPADEAYAFHKTAFVLATAAPLVPQGATFGTSQNWEGVALRWLRDYDGDYAIDRSIVDCFTGTGVVTDDDQFLRGFKLTMDVAAIEAAKAGAVNEVP